MRDKIVNFLIMKKINFFLFFFLPLLLSHMSCISMNHKKDLIKKNEEIKDIAMELQLKEKTITDILDRLSWKDQEIGRLTDELRNSKTIIASLSKDIEKLRETDLLEHLSVKDQEIGKLTDELHTTQSTITNLKTDIGKLCEIDVQVEEKKEEVNDKIEEGISVDPLHATSKASLEIIENKKLE